jgi:hypothetical protein
MKARVKRTETVMMWDAAGAHRDRTLGSSPNALPSMEPETTKNDQDCSFRCPSDPFGRKSRSRAFFNFSESKRV